MARISITGYVDTEDLPSEAVDLDHDMGLTNAAYEALIGVSGETPPFSLSDLQDLEFSLQKD